MGLMTSSLPVLVNQVYVETALDTAFQGREPISPFASSVSCDVLSEGRFCAPLMQV